LSSWVISIILVIIDCVLRLAAQAQVAIAGRHRAWISGRKQHYLCLVARYDAQGTVAFLLCACLSCSNISILNATRLPCLVGLNASVVARLEHVLSICTAEPPTKPIVSDETAQDRLLRAMVDVSDWEGEAAGSNPDSRYEVEIEDWRRVGELWSNTLSQQYPQLVRRFQVVVDVN